MQLFAVFFLLIASQAGAYAQSPTGVGYEYDDLGRLTRVMYYEKGVQYVYSYDAAGNRNASEVGQLDLFARLQDTYVVEGQLLRFQIALDFPVPEGNERSLYWRILTATEAAELPEQVQGGHSLAEHGTDFPFPQSAQMILPVGVTEAFVEVQTTSDAISELGEVLYVTLYDPVELELDPDFQTKKGVLLDADLNAFSISANKLVVSPGESVTYTVTRDAATSFGSLPVTFEAQNGTVVLGSDFNTPTPTSHDFSSKDETATVTVATNAGAGNGSFTFAVNGEIAGVPVEFARQTTSIDDGSGSGGGTGGGTPTQYPPSAKNDTYDVLLADVGPSSLAVFDIIANDVDANHDFSIEDRHSVLTIGDLRLTMGNAADVTYSVQNNRLSFATEVCATYAFAYDITDPENKVSNTATVTINASSEAATGGGLNCGAPAGNEPPVVQDKAFTANIGQVPGEDSTNIPYYKGTFALVNSSDTDPDNDMLSLNWINVTYSDGTLTPITQIGNSIELETSRCGMYMLDFGVSDGQGHVVAASAQIVVQDNTGQICDTQIAGPTFNVSDAAVLEGGTLGFSMTRTVNHPSQKTGIWSVHYYTEDVTAQAGVDYVPQGSAASPVRVIFDANVGQVAIPVQTINDGIVEGDKTMRVVLVNPVGNTSIGRNPGLGTITDAGETPPSFSVSGQSATEGEALVFTVTKTGSVSSSFSVDYATANGSASADDYTAASGTLTFAANETSKTVTVPTVQDSDFEQSETVLLNLVNATGGATITTSQASAGIGNDDGEPYIHVFNSSGNEGNSGTTSYTMTVFLAGGTREDVSFKYFTVDGAAVAGSDYVAIPPTSATIPAGSYEHSFTVTVNGDVDVESDEMFTVDVSDLVNARRAIAGDIPANPTKATPGTFNIKNDDDYSWYTGGWSSWSGSSCGTQTRTRSVYCKSPSGSQVSDSYCSGTKPASSDSRTYYTYSWNTGSWSGWSGTCPTETRTRTVNCKRCNGTTVGDSYCSGTKPSSSESRAKACYTYSWAYSSWGSWIGTCGSSPTPNQYHTRSVYCKRSDGTTVSNSNCTGTKPADTAWRTCYTFSWYTSSWVNEGNCGANGLQLQTRTVYCKKSPGGGTASDSKCGGTKPTDWRQVSCTPSGGGQPL